MTNRLGNGFSAQQVTAARQALNWQPARDDLATVMMDVWKWEAKATTQLSHA